MKCRWTLEARREWQRSREQTQYILIRQEKGQDLYECNWGVGLREKEWLSLHKMQIFLLFSLPFFFFFFLWFLFLLYFYFFSTISLYHYVPTFYLLFQFICLVYILIPLFISLFFSLFRFFFFVFTIFIFFFSLIFLTFSFCEIDKKKRKILIQKF